MGSQSQRKNRLLPFRTHKTDYAISIERERVFKGAIGKAVAFQAANYASEPLDINFLELFTDSNNKTLIPPRLSFSRL